jgi:hypothetical protein
MTPASNSNQEKKGLFLKYQDFKKLERIIEDYNLDDNNNIDFNNMKSDEKEILWKIKTIIRNMESVRLRVTTRASELDDKEND